MINFNNTAFIFDMDGTLVDNMHAHAAAWGKLLAENGLEMDLSRFLVNTAGRTNREIIPEVFGEISNDRLTELALRKESLYRESYLPERRPVAGVIEFLTEAKRLGIKMAVATAAQDANTEFILDGLELRQYFDAVTTGTEVKTGKPDPAMFLVSAKKLSVHPNASMVFEDAIGGFEAAHRAGMRSIGIATVNSVEDILTQPSVVEAHHDFVSLDPQTLVERYLKNAEAAR